MRTKHSSWAPVLKELGFASAFAGLLGPSVFTSVLSPGDSPGMKPLNLNPRVGLGQNKMDDFANRLNTSPLYKKSSVGGNMNHTEIVRKFREKRAAGGGTFLGGMLKEVAKPSLQTVLFGLGAGALASNLYSRYQDNAKSEAAYKDMFVKFPELQEVDQNKINDYWGLMQEYAPSMTRNPLVAGQFIKNMVDYNLKGVDFPTLKSVLDIELAANKRRDDIMSTIVKSVGGKIDE